MVSPLHPGHPSVGMPPVYSPRVAIDDARMQHLTNVADPVVDVDFGAAQAQRRFTAHGDAMGALSTVQTVVFEIAHFPRVPTRQHLVHQTIIVGCLVARIEAFEPVSVLDKDLLEDVPGLRGCCKHQGAPGWGVGMVVVQLLYHVSHAQSTPASAFPGARFPTSPTLQRRERQGRRKMQIPVRSSIG